MTPGNPAQLSYLFQLVFGLYMLVTTVVLINLLIAMMSDTYQRIQVFYQINKGLFKTQPTRADNPRSPDNQPSLSCDWCSNNRTLSGSLDWPS